MLPIFFEQRIGSILTTSGFQAGCHPPRIAIEKLTVNLDAQQLISK